MTRIVILGNSLSMPRPKDGIKYSDIYAYKLIKSGFEVINRSRRINDIEIQSLEQNIVDDVDDLSPDYLVVHLGIVDCAPRLFSKGNRRILGLLPDFIVNKIITTLSRYRSTITKIRKITFVDVDLFEVLLRLMIVRIKKNNPNINIFILKILQTNKRNIGRSHNFDINIQKYNDVIEKVSREFRLSTKVIDPNFFYDGLLKDGIHINKGMHKYISDQVLQSISKVSAEYN